MILPTALKIPFTGTGNNETKIYAGGIVSTQTARSSSTICIAPTTTQATSTASTITATSKRYNG